MDASEPRNLAPDLPARLKQKPRWILNRLRCMTPAEVAFRVLRALQARAERFGALGKVRVPAPDLQTTFEAWISIPSGVDVPHYLAAAERIHGGMLDIFALRGVDLGQPPRWNRDPKSGIQAPLAHGKTLDYRNPDLVGDIKYLWEPNRHLHLVTLAQAYALSGNPKYFHDLAEQLDSWFIACPRGLGPNWASPALDYYLPDLRLMPGPQWIREVDIVIPYSAIGEPPRPPSCAFEVQADVWVQDWRFHVIRLRAPQPTQVDPSSLTTPGADGFQPFIEGG